MRRKRVIALTWLASLTLALACLVVGHGIDEALAGNGIVTLVWGVPLALVSGLAARAALGLCSRSLVEAETDTRGRILRHVLALGAAERTRERAGRIVNSATDGVERSATYRASFVAPMIASLGTPLVIVLVITLALDPVAGGVLAVAVPVVPLVIGAFQSVVRPVSRRYRAASHGLAAQELDAIQGISALALMNAGQRMGVSLAAAAEDVRRRVMGYLAGNQIVLLVVDSVFSLGITTGAVLLAMWRIHSGALSVGEGVALLLLSAIMLDPLDRIGQFFYIGMGGIAATKEIERFLAQSPLVTDAPGVREPAAPLAPGEVSLEGVDFEWEEGVPVLRGADLHLTPGEHVALTGISGAGKSTLSALLQAVRRPERGRILLEGHDLTEVPLTWVRSRMAVVEQNTHLFSASLRDNLRIADPDASDERLLEALHAAHLDDLLARLPEGLNTPVGDRGAALSGGEAQRVAIARAFLKDAPLLLLDEPTAHVDLASEREILSALAEISEHRTTLTISHRDATIHSADRRVELTDGVIR